MAPEVCDFMLDFAIRFCPISAGPSAAAKNLGTVVSVAELRIDTNNRRTAKAIHSLLTACWRSLQGSVVRSQGGPQMVEGSNQSGAAEDVTSKAEGATGKAAEGTKSATDALQGDFKEVFREAGRAVTNEIKSAIAEAAAESLAPAARKATTSALGYATTKAPDLVQGVVKDTVAPRLKEAGGAKALAGTLMGKFPGAVTKGAGMLSKVPGVGRLGSMLGGKGGGDGGPEQEGIGRGRRLPMQGSIDVSVPVEVAYNQWTQFEEFPKFMYRVERIEQKDDTHLVWHEKIWGIRRQWEAEIVEQRPNERIMWRSTNGPRNVGVVNFHQLHDPRLSRVHVNLDFEPNGIIEKTGRGWRAAIRAFDTDLQRFKAFVEMKDAATGEWRGRVKDGEVQPEEGEAEPTEEQAQAEGREQPAEEQAEEQAQAQAEEQPAGEQAQDQEQARAGGPDGDRAKAGEEAEGEEEERAAAPAAEASDDGQKSGEEAEGESVVPQRRRRKG
jgi:uncharacterized membrane protein